MKGRHSMHAAWLDRSDRRWALTYARRFASRVSDTRLHHGQANEEHDEHATSGISAQYVNQECAGSHDGQNEDQSEHDEQPSSAVELASRTASSAAHSVP